MQDIEGTRDEVIEKIAEELKTRLLAQVLEPDFRTRFLAVGKALQGSNATLAMAVICQVMLACGDNLKRLVRIEPADGEVWTQDERDSLSRDVVMEAASRVVSDTMDIVPANGSKLAEDLAVEEARQQGEKAFLKLIGGKDIAPKRDETKH
jgi:hypothetical protein